MTRSQALTLAVLALAACKKSGDTPATSGRRGAKLLQYPVDVAKLESRQIQYAVQEPGTIDAFQQVQITARVAGAVDRVAFAEGQQVKAGDVLAVIESDRYEIALDQAKTAVSKADAAEKDAEAALDRRLAAQKESPGLVPGEEIEQKKTAVDTAKADLAAAREAQKVAELNLRDSQVRAPIGGIVQTRTVQQGQYLEPGAVLATILQRDPMLLRFEVKAQDAPRLKPGMTANLQLKESARTFTAKITLVQGSADPTTRMVPVTAEIDQTDHQYWLRPGAFCEVSVPIGDARQGIVVPSLAVQPTEKGNVVYVVDDKSIAHQEIVEEGMHTATGGIELTRGVTAGELMVVNGIDPLTDGAPVKVDHTLTMDQADAAGSGSGGDAGSDADAGSAAGAAPAAPAAAGSDAAAPGAGSGHHHKKAAQ